MNRNLEAGKVGAMTIESLEQLYRDRYPRLLRLALATVGSREAAADVVQEVFARAIRHRDEFRGEGSLESWIWRMVINTGRTQQKRGRRRAELERSQDLASTNGHAEPWPELRAAVAALPERQRQALFLRHYADLDYEQIGEVLGIARGTVSATLHAAHRTLRETLEGARA
ncbi:MAG TPA: sigma-70 family RNA polymerase sigma factor [Gaiellaceae bacterium]